MNQAAGSAPRPPRPENDRADCSLAQAVTRSIQAYFEALDGHEPAALYRLVLSEVERPLLESVLQRAEGNQSRAAAWLGISRGTLRKKMKEYGLD